MPQRYMDGIVGASQGIPFLGGRISWWHGDELMICSAPTSLFGIQILCLRSQDILWLSSTHRINVLWQ